MRTILDFGRLHGQWCKAIEALHGRLPSKPYMDAPIEMTLSEFRIVEHTYAYRLRTETDPFLMGHPIKVVEVPAGAIAIPGHA